VAAAAVIDGLGTNQVTADQALTWPDSKLVVSSIELELISESTIFRVYLAS
jgi:hypothetical protein